MTAAKPCMGFPSRSAAIHALKQAGWKERQIAVRLDINPNTVSSLVARYRSRLGSKQDWQTITVEGSVFNDLLNAANLRGTSIDTLVSKLLERIVIDNLIDAVLDDQD